MSLIKVMTLPCSVGWKWWAVLGLSRESRESKTRQRVIAASRDVIKDRSAKEKALGMVKTQDIYP